MFVHLNYLVLRGLNLVRAENERAAALYDDIKARIIRTVSDGWSEDGILWEMYD